MTMLSYAQNGEDVVLSRAFGADQAGFYVDVGAADPLFHSVTRHFYERGWSGINIEPVRATHAALERERPRDVNLGVGLAARPGSMTFYELPPEMAGCSSFSETIAAGYARQGLVAAERAVEVTTLVSVCERWASDRTIDFLKVDVEGDERAVLEGADFTRFRPRILVIESTRPGTTTPAFEEWEPLVTGAGYRFALFDGLNRFYVRDEDAKLVPLLAAPANVLDDYERYDTRIALEEAARVRDALRRAEARIERLDRELVAAGSHETRLEAALSQLRAELDEPHASVTAGLRADLDDARSELHRARGQLADARMELAAARRALADQSTRGV
jgi:FkbM family methyltransferase